MLLGAFVLGMAGVVLFVLAKRTPEASLPDIAAPPTATRRMASASVAVGQAAPMPAAAPDAEGTANGTPVPAAVAGGTATARARATDKKVAGGASEEAALAQAPPSGELRQKCVELDAEGKGKARAVAAACRLALEANPKDSEVMVILARADIDRGRLGEARVLARKALAVDPTRVEAYVYLGTAEQEAGKVEEARAADKKYIELAPDGRFARELRAILNNL
jgi:Flp pilus assembly protein TadD